MVLPCLSIGEKEKSSVNKSILVGFDFFDRVYQMYIITVYVLMEYQLDQLVEVAHMDCCWGAPHSSIIYSTVVSGLKHVKLICYTPD